MQACSENYLKKIEMSSSAHENRLQFYACALFTFSDFQDLQISLYRRFEKVTT